MNERIQQLAEQAHFYQADDNYFTAAQEEFARLIVRECAGLVDHVRMEDGTTRGEFIRKHFGVAE